MIMHTCVYIVFLSLAVCWSSSAFAQSDPSIGSTPRKVYAFTSDIPIVGCDPYTKTENNNKNIAPQAKFIIVDSGNQKSSLYFLNWDEENLFSKNVEGIKLNKKYNITSDKNDGNDKKYWCVDNKILKSHAKEIKPIGDLGVDFGVLTVPIKLRIKNSKDDDNFYFTTQASIAGAVDFNWRISETKDIFFGLTVFAGTTGITLTPDNSSVESDEEAVALSYGLGPTLHVDNVGFSAMIGFDCINDNKKRGWIYHDEPWIGLSIGSSTKVTQPSSASSNDD